MKNRYRNLWHKSLNAPKPEFYENDAKPVLMHRRVTVFKLFDHGFDFVLGGACIAQRAGISEAQDVIDSILSGGTPVSEEVAAHLRSLGFPGYSYADYHADYIAGRAA